MTETLPHHVPRTTHRFPKGIAYNQCTEDPTEKLSRKQGCDVGAASDLPRAAGEQRHGRELGLGFRGDGHLCRATARPAGPPALSPAPALGRAANDGQLAIVTAQSSWERGSCPTSG